MGRRFVISKEDTKENDTMSMANEMSRMSFESARHSIDRSMSLDRKVIGYKTMTISELIYEDEVLKKSNYGDMLLSHKH